MTQVQAITSLPNWREPSVGDDICLRTSLYLSHGADDFQGGLCQIVRVIDRRDDPDCTALDINKLSVEVAEREGWTANWYYLIQEEEKNLEKYGDKRGRKDPDYSPSSNEWW